MTDPFQKLPEEKKQRIIRAALKEFADKGYEQASTNRIVKEAGIGKGMLFYYFNSKQDLYLYLIDYSFETVKEHYLNRIDDSIEDVIDRLGHVARIKFEFLARFPEVTAFLGRFILDVEKEWPEPFKKKYEEIYALLQERLYRQKRIDRTKFRDGVDPDKAFQLIKWAMKGYEQDLREAFRGKKLSEVDLTPYWQEFDEYLAVLKKCFYK
ncbi:hypothetical protein B4135_2939 [Caldibacillus debilis]|uniref:HTH tetR-type domain-containing protein n=1 Tax=Caldibacillus debilis TaxID=301148 RepID=A0A150LMU8_9BACI|nr:hypothetical protein B4135_2939 [Caldibacillus debilis]